MGRDEISNNFSLADIDYNVETEHKMVIKALRELYMHGVVKSGGTVDVTDQQVIQPCILNAYRSLA